MKIALIVVLCLLAACGNKQNTPIDPHLTDSTQVREEIPKTTATGSSGVQLIVSSGICKLYDAADPAASEIGRYRQGEVLLYQNEVTTFSTPMRIHGIDYDEPWVKAKSADGKEGWLYAGNIRFNGLSDSKLAEMIFDRRLYKVFGEALTLQLKVYQKEMADVKTLPAFRMLFHRSEELRSKIDAKVNELLALATRDSLPDFFWLNEAFPGFLVHLIKNGSEYRLFRDFRHWAALAEQTTEDVDNVLIGVYLTAYQSDSIEFLHQDWRLALSEAETYSLLGRGIHKSVLDGIEAALQQSADFEPELTLLKQQLLDDISLSTDYWMDKTAILEELDAILASKYTIIAKADRVELQARRKMLMDAAKFGLRTNLFEGGL